MPQRGAKLGHFGIVRIDNRESRITDAEWMQTKPPNFHDVAACERYGSDNSVLLAKVRATGSAAQSSGSPDEDECDGRGRRDGGPRDGGRWGSSRRANPGSAARLQTGQRAARIAEF